MPEYLAPAVYVEEVDTGSKPIEGVSTSTTGMVGVTERGPVNVPILVTSKGEFWRWFGQTLDRSFGAHRYLPHAIDGFFTNGGKRVYITRVLDTSLATPARFTLFYDGATGPAETVLLRASAELTGSAANPPPLVALSGNNLNVNDWMRIGDGSASEYRQITSLAAETVVVPLHLPFARAHGLGATLRQFTLAAATAQYSLMRAVQPGAAILEVEGASADINGLAQGQLLRIDGANGEFRFVQGVTNVADAAAGRRTARVALDAPLALGHAAAANVVERFAIPAPGPAAVPLAPASAGGAAVVFVTNRGGAFNTRTDLVVVDEADAVAREVRRIGELRQATLASGVPMGCEDGSVVSEVGLAASKTIQVTAAPIPTTTVFGVNDVSNIAAGQRLEVNGTERTVTLVVPGAAPAGVITVAPPLGAAAAGNVVLLGPSPIIQVTAAPAPTVTAFGVNDASNLAPGQRVLVNGVPRTISSLAAGTAPAAVVTVTPALGAAPAAGNPVVPVRQLQAPGATRGSTFLRLDNRLGLAAGNVLRITSGPFEEFVTIESLPNQAAPGVKPDAGSVLLEQPLARDYADATTEVAQMLAPTAGALQPTVAVLQVPPGGTMLLLADGAGYTPPAPPAGRFISLRTPEGEVSYHRITALSAVAAPMMVELNQALDRAHGVGSPLAERVSLLDAEALDVGAWGNRLRLSVARETTPLASTTLANVVVPSTQVRLGSLTGVEPGTVLEMRDGSGALVGGLLKVQAVDRNSGIVTLQGTGLDFFQQAAWAALAPGASLSLASREFQLRVELLRQPDALYPARNKTVIQQEDFRGLSMDPRHSRYAPRLLGMIGGPLRRSDRRPEGDSELVRLRDASTVAATQQSIRVGPEFLTDVLPDGRIERARHALLGGGDSIGTLGDADYIGQDDPNPELRTGLQTLRNVEEISIVGAPGNTSIAVQNALINHCELMRYRFAALDGNPPPNDAMANIQAQRQQFDTKYAALYHPWLLIPDPYPVSTGTVPDYPIPPSGHMLGIYARTDIERGVHKAPANEVVRGVTGLQRLLNKEQHDILNPYPVNINVIRDFRPNNRGIRIYGGRVITSDSDWKYVNVRRLLIFIEASIDRGLQWVVFEPNAEPLWARVRRSISNFLTLVWRNGALEGTKVEEAYFVKCDRTTMTQTDIDQGRLIVLVGVAPVKPAEFVIVRIGLWTAHADE